MHLAIGTAALAPACRLFADKAEMRQGNSMVERMALVVRKAA